jgi:hypothetical protein
LGGLVHHRGLWLGGVVVTDEQHHHVRLMLQLNDFIRAWYWAIDNRPGMTPGVIAWMWQRLLDLDEAEL